MEIQINPQTITKEELLKICRKQSETISWLQKKNKANSIFKQFLELFR